MGFASWAEKEELPPNVKEVGGKFHRVPSLLDSEVSSLHIWLLFPVHSSFLRLINVEGFIFTLLELLLAPVNALQEGTP